MATLNPHSEFFTESGDESVSTALLNAVDKIDPEMKPIICILCGDWGNDAPNTWQDASSSWRQTFEKIFWDNGKSPLKNNKKATLWVGYYRPILRTTADGKAYAPTEQWLKDRLDDIAKLLKELNSLVNGLPLADKLINMTKTFDPKTYIDTLLGSKYL